MLHGRAVEERGRRIIRTRRAAETGHRWHNSVWSGAPRGTARRGAGDAFVAGYLSGLLDGEDIPARLHRAVTTAAFAVATRGDWEGLPAQDELALLDQPDGTTVR